MHALFLSTYTEDCEKNWKSWQCLGHKATIEVYDNRPHERQGEIVALAKELKPDVIVYIGAIEQYHKRPVLQPRILRELRNVAPSVHICGDASDSPWWPWLSQYDIEECFDLQVSIDGSFDTPIADMEAGIVKLTPTDPSSYENLPWGSRGTFLGMAGGLGHGERMNTINFLHAHAGLQWRQRLPFRDMCQFLSGCKIVLNVPMNGTGNKDHVKGRVLEAGWAGACLLERRNQWTSQWFPEGSYLQYTKAGDVIDLLDWARLHDDKVADMAAQFHKFVDERHHPRVFWTDVLTRAGVHYADE